MTEITITIEVNGKIIEKVNMDMDADTYNKINEICKERKYPISDLIINDITEMTPEKAEEIVYSWDM